MDTKNKKSIPNHFYLVILHIMKNAILMLKN